MDLKEFLEHAETHKRLTDEFMSGRAGLWTFEQAATLAMVHENPGVHLEAVRGEFGNDVLAMIEGDMNSDLDELLYRDDADDRLYLTEAGKETMYYLRESIGNV